VTRVLIVMLERHGRGVQMGVLSSGSCVEERVNLAGGSVRPELRLGGVCTCACGRRDVRGKLGCEDGGAGG
jgi:hypothetical protein